MSGTTTSKNKYMEMASKTNLFNQWIPPDFLQPIHKLLLNRGRFCDPYQHQEESDLESDDGHDTTTTTAIAEDQVIKVEKETTICANRDQTSNISTPGGISEDESDASTTSIDHSLPESTQQREILPVESTISNDPDEEVELQLSQDGVEIFLDDHPLRSPSCSGTASEERVDLIDQGDESTVNETVTSPVAALPSNHKILPTPCSDVCTIMKFLLFWVGLLCVFVILQPASIYDSEWFLQRVQQTTTTIQTQRQECGALLGGHVDTDCALEIVQDKVKIQVASCHAYYNQGETDTSCILHVFGQAISTRTRRVRNSVQDWFHEIQDQLTLEFSKCQTFLQHREHPTGCILEPPYNFVYQGHAGIRTQTQNVLDYSGNQVDVCQVYLMENYASSSGCFMEDLIVEWKNLLQRTNAKLESTKEQVLRHYADCQHALSGNVDGDSVLQGGQRAIKEQLEWITAKISDLPTRISIVASSYGYSFKATTGVDVEGVKTLESETRQQQQVVALQTTSDQQKDTSDGHDDVSTTFGPTSSSFPDSAMPTESFQNENVVRNDPRHNEKQRQYALSYFDDLEPIPEDRIPPRSAFQGEKKTFPRGNKDHPIKSSIHEPIVHDQGPTNKVNTIAIDINNVVGDKIEHHSTVSDVNHDESTVTDHENPSQSELPEQINNVKVDDMDEEIIVEQISMVQDSTADDGSSSPPISSSTMTATTISVVEFKDESETWIDEKDNVNKETEAGATTSELVSTNINTNVKGEGNLLGEMDFVKLEYDSNGIPYLVKGVKR